LLAQAPTTTIRQTPVPILHPESYGNEFSITDANGRPFNKPLYEDVQGSAYFLDSLKPSVIMLTNGNSFRQIPARLDLYKQEIHVLSRNKEEFILPTELVKEIIFADSSSSKVKQFVFRPGFPAIDDQTPTSFYQVITEGRIIMLEFIKKKILERKNDISGEVTKEFESYEEYYVLADNQMTKLKKDKSFILSLVKDRDKEMQSYLASGNPNFRKWTDIQSFFLYYNSLSK
jgi:predicted transcriptional regulator